MTLFFSILSLVFFFSFTQNVSATPSGLTFQGRLAKDGTAVSGSVILTLRVTSPNADQCTLFEETHSFTIAASDEGVFSVVIGAGTRTSNDKGFSIVNIFSNTGAAISGLTCPGTGATSYTPLSSHSRYVYAHFTTDVGVVSFNDPYVIQSVPYALEAEKLAGRSSSEYLQTTTDTTQSKLNALMAPVGYAELLAILNGTSSQYMTTSNSGPTKLPVLSSAPPSPSAGQIWYEGGLLKYYDGVGAQTKTLGTAATGVTAGTYNSVTIDADGRATAGSNALQSLPGAAAQTVGMQRNPTAATAGQGLTIDAGGATAGTADLAGGDLTLKSGIATGTGSSNIYFQTATPGATAVTDRTPSTKMTILGNGNVGIGTTVPGFPLEVSGTVKANFFNVDSNTGLFLNAAGSIGLRSNGATVLKSFASAIEISQPIYGASQSARVNINAATTTVPAFTFRDWTTLGMGGSPSAGLLSFITASQPRLNINSSGSVGIGTTSPNYQLDVVGDINTSTCFRIGATTVSGTCTSDERLKENIQNYDAGLSDLLKVKLHTYTFNGLGEMPKTGEVAVGVIAQELEKTNPELVKTRLVKMHPEDKEKTEIKVVDYSKFSYMLINAVKELYQKWFKDHAMLEKHDKDLNLLKQDNQELKNQIRELKAYICNKDPEGSICRP